MTRPKKPTRFSANFACITTGDARLIAGQLRYCAVEARSGVPGRVESACLVLEDVAAAIVRWADKVAMRRSDKQDEPHGLLEPPRMSAPRILPDPNRNSL